MPNIGKTYFKANYSMMINDIYTIIKNNNNITLFDIITMQENEKKLKLEEKLRKA